MGYAAGTWLQIEFIGINRKIDRIKCIELAENKKRVTKETRINSRWMSKTEVLSVNFKTAKIKMKPAGKIVISCIFPLEFFKQSDSEYRNE